MGAYSLAVTVTVQVNNVFTRKWDGETEEKEKKALKKEMSALKKKEREKNKPTCR